MCHECCWFVSIVSQHHNDSHLYKKLSVLIVDHLMKIENALEWSTFAADEATHHIKLVL